MQLLKTLPPILLGLSLLACTAGETRTEDQEPAPARLQTGTDIYMEAAFKQFDKYLANCSKTFGYDPDNVADEGAFELEPGEEDWRGCAYEGVQKILVPKTRSPELYETLVNSHKILTEQMKKRIVTRGERRAKIGAIVLDIQLEEAKQAPGTEASEPEAQRNQRLRNQMQSLRSLGYI